MSTNETMRKSLRERAKDFTVLLPFMEGKEKGDAAELLGTSLQRAFPVGHIRAAHFGIVLLHGEAKCHSAPTCPLSHLSFHLFFQCLNPALFRWVLVVW